MKRNIFTISLIISVFLAASTFSGCSSADKQKKEKDNVVVLTFFDKNRGDPFDDDVAKEISKRTGVKIDIQQPTGNPMEKLNLMLASGDYPDIVLMDRSESWSTVDRYISAEALIPLNDLIKKYGSNVTKMYGDILNKVKRDDGNIYYLPNWYGKTPKLAFGILMRQDILRGLVGENAANGHAFTQEEFTKLLRDFKEKYSSGGSKQTIPLTFEADDMNGIIGTMKGMFGMKTYYMVNGQLKYDVRDPRYLEMLKYFNSLYRQGLVDREWITNKKELWTYKLTEENILASTGSYWSVTDINTVMQGTASKEAQYYAYKVVAAGIKPSETTYGGRSSLGWDAIGITKNCKNPKSAMKLIDFLASEEGQYLMLWGVEGKTWNIVNGKHQPTEDILRAFKQNFSDTPKITGVRQWTWFIKNGYGSDGTPFDLAVQYQKTPAELMAEKNLGDTYWDTADFEMLLPKSSTDEFLKYQSIIQIFNQAFPKIIDAPSEAEAVNLYNKMVQDMDKEGLTSVEKVINDNYKARLKNNK